ncbi:MAG: hypothetical protein J0L82_03800 [Deltaproteobacteria bacterium]|nr:hypothetical protein [Deltaproteobacteria bacterium]
MSAVFILLIAGLAVLSACTSAPKLKEVRFSKEEAVPLDATQWKITYDGDGKAEFQKSGIFLQPRVPKHDQDTIAALVVSRFLPRQNDFRLRVRYLVERQLRRNEGTSESAPRPWEVFWLFWGYREGRSPALKETNYFILKSNGVELGRAFEETEQTFLATATTPKLALAHSHELVLTRISNRVSVDVDGISALEFSNSEWPQAFYEANGKIGLYVEDAGAVVQGVWISYPEAQFSASHRTP